MKIPIRGFRSRQRGYAEALVPLMTLIVIGALAVLLVTLILSFVLPTRLLKGKARISAVAVVALIWVALFWRYVGEPELYKKWRRATIEDCRAELAHIPELIRVDGFLDEGAALRKDMLLQLFSERGLSFVEIRVRQSNGKAPHIVYPDGDFESSWTLANPRTSTVRLELSADDDPACTALPDRLEERITQPPFLPNTCIKLTYLDAPTARYVLQLQPAAPLPSRKQGRWQLVDRLNGQMIASLPTVDPLSGIPASRKLSSDARRPVNDCRSPHTVLVDRLRSARPAAEPLNSQVLAREEIQATTDVIAISTSSTKLPEVVADAEETLWTEEEEQMLFNPELHQNGWREAVATAKKQGRAPYGSQLLDWDKKKLVSLKPTTQDPYPWKVFSDGNGFFAVSTSPSWYERSSNLLVRYRRDGTLAWSVRVLTPSTPKHTCQKFWPQAVYATSSHLVLADRCQKLSYDQQKKTGKRVIGERWSIPLNALPRTD
jgi:hypothetical protein